MAQCADACHSPSFLKKITEMPIKTMALPSSFVSTHGNLLSSNVILEGPSRKHWRVGVDGSFNLGEGFQSFVADHVLQLGDQLCFILPSHSHFQVQVYDESGCQKRSALDATGSHATPPETIKMETTRTSTFLSRRPAELQIPPVEVTDSASQTPTSTKPALRLSEIRRASDPIEEAEQLLLYARENAQKELNDLQLRKDSGLRDSLRIPDVPRDSPVPLRKYTSGRSTSALFGNKPYQSADESVPELDLSECFVDIEKARAAPDLLDTEPLSPEDLRPCWE